MKRCIMIVVGALALPCLALTGFDADFDAVAKRAKASSKPMFVLFTGSDWCSWCVKLEKEVLSKREFLDYATNAWELAVVDFPRKKTVDDGVKMRRRELMRKYSISGFPTVLLLDGNGKTLRRGGYCAGGAKAWLERFNRGCEISPSAGKPSKQ